ncbi:MAG: hypothetical protein WDO73_25380 [Ignavibacteriota bacterium]
MFRRARPVVAVEQFYSNGPLGSELLKQAISHPAQVRVIALAAIDSCSAVPA